MSLSTPESVQKLQTALHAKAKESPSYRFYALYDKVYRPDVLLHAYACCKANKGAAGVDGQDFEDIEKYGLERWLGELTHELKGKTYQPAAVRRVYIPKAGQSGKFRPLFLFASHPLPHHLRCNRGCYEKRNSPSEKVCDRQRPDAAELQV